jgi:twitching motility protein PilT
MPSIIAQRLIPKVDGSGRVVCTEVMIMNDSIRSLIRDRRFQQIVSMIEIGGKDGMLAFDESVAELYAKGLITRDEALLNSRDPSRVNSIKPPAPPRKGFFS